MCPTMSASHQTVSGNIDQIKYGNQVSWPPIRSFFLWAHFHIRINPCLYLLITTFRGSPKLAKLTVLHILAVEYNIFHMEDSLVGPSQYHIISVKACFEFFTASLSLSLLNNYKSSPLYPCLWKYREESPQGSPCTVTTDILIVNIWLIISL